MSDSDGSSPDKNTSFGPEEAEIYFKAFEEAEKLLKTLTLDEIVSQKPTSSTAQENKEGQNEADHDDEEGGNTNVPGGFLSEEDEDEEELQNYSIKKNKRRFFTPSLQVMRNNFVGHSLRKLHDEQGPLEKICVMGCGEMSLEAYLFFDLNSLGTREVLSVDIDGPTLEKGLLELRVHLIENGTEVGRKRGLPCQFLVFQGDITTFDCRFMNADCICSVEVIEHMPLEEANKFVDLVFNVLRPKMFVLTTPNHDYNEAFDREPGIFRHDDHKFEFTMTEFEEWVEMWAEKYPGYDFDRFFIGQLKGFDHLRGATQAFVAKRKPKTEQRDVPEVSETKYALVGNFVANFGLEIWKSVVIRDGFAEWLANNELEERDLVKGSFSQYWLINIKDIMKHMKAPECFLRRIEDFHVSDELRAGSYRQLHIDQRKNGIFLAIPSTQTKRKLKRIVRKWKICD